VDDSCFICNIATSTSPNGIAVLINSSGELGTTTSSARFKDEIQPMDQASEALFALRPLAFRYKKDIDPAGTPQFGLVAEDVDKVNPNLIVRDKEGKPYSVRYDQVNAMLLNEFLKEHKAFVEQQRKLEQQGATIARQQKQIEALAAGLQKVSARLELRKPAPQTVLNSQ
jgi:Chaperone of endosialidase